MYKSFPLMFYGNRQKTCWLQAIPNLTRLYSFSLQESVQENCRDHSQSILQCSSSGGIISSATVLVRIRIKSVGACRRDSCATQQAVHCNASKKYGVKGGVRPVSRANELLFVYYYYYYILYTTYSMQVIQTFAVGSSYWIVCFADRRELF